LMCDIIIFVTWITQFIAQVHPLLNKVQDVKECDARDDAIKYCRPAPKIKSLLSVIQYFSS
jgi:hypothetical protein